MWDHETMSMVGVYRILIAIACQLGTCSRASGVNRSLILLFVVIASRQDDAGDGDRRGEEGAGGATVADVKRCDGEGQVYVSDGSVDDEDADDVAGDHDQEG